LLPRLAGLDALLLPLFVVDLPLLQITFVLSLTLRGRSGRRGADSLVHLELEDRQDPEHGEQRDQREAAAAQAIDLRPE
jgi:hypothetical protein